MLYRVLNFLLLVGLLFCLGCSQRNPKKPVLLDDANTEEIEDEDPRLDEQSIELELPPLPPVPRRPVIPPPPPPAVVPVPLVPIVVPVIIPEEEEEEECPVPELADTGEPCEEPDHFLSYPFNTLIELPERTVNLDDEFIDESNFTVGNGLRLLNPATKYHRGKILKPETPNTHYIAVEVTPEDVLDFLPNRDLLVFNQFQTHTISIPDDLVIGDDDNPVMELLVPSVKESCPGGDCVGDDCDGCFPDGDHYLCYELDGEENHCPFGVLSFKDQFINSRLVDRIVPKRICNPVRKTFNDESTSFNGAETNHLVCYEVLRKSIPLRLITLLNQFGEQKGFVRHNEEICVPSTELILPPEEEEDEDDVTK